MTARDVLRRSRRLLSTASRPLRVRLGSNPTEPPQAFPAGASYSPVPDAELLLREPDRSRVWPESVRDPAGIDVRPDAQLRLLDRLGAFRLPDGHTGPEPRYDPTNDQFPPQDAAVLYAMVRLLAPSRIVEVGCGWSTTVTARAIADGDAATELTCIDPNPRDFLVDLPQVTHLRREKVEHTPMAVMEALGPGDLLFIDSSHVVKTGSDVVHQFLEVLPRLQSGVVVHVHDVFLPEDYPQGWVRAGFGWNEQYLLQAFLVGHATARVAAMNRWLALRHSEAVRDAFGDIPLDGSSVWFTIGDVPQLGA